MRYDRARTSLDRHATHVAAAYVARSSPNCGIPNALVSGGHAQR